LDPKVAMRLWMQGLDKVHGVVEEILLLAVLRRRCEKNWFVCRAKNLYPACPCRIFV